MCEGCIHWFIISLVTIDSEPAVIRPWARLCNYTALVNDVISYLDKFSSWTELNNSEYKKTCWLVYHNVNQTYTDESYYIGNTEEFL